MLHVHVCHHSKMQAGEGNEAKTYVILSLDQTEVVVHVVLLVVVVCSCLLLPPPRAFQPFS